MLLVLVAAAVVWAVLRRAEPPRINFARVKRETLVSTLPTNGKVEPVEWQAVRTETAGVVSRVSIAEGQSVAKGAEMAVLSDPSLEADIAAAEARASEARANVAAVEAGGKPADFTEIDNSLARARL